MSDRNLEYRIIVVAIIVSFLAIMAIFPYFFGWGGVLIDVIICAILYFISKGLVIGG